MKRRNLLAATLFTPFLSGTATAKKLTAPQASCIKRSGYSTRVTGGPKIAFDYLLNGVVRTISLNLTKDTKPTAKVEWRVGKNKFSAERALPDKIPVKFGTGPAMRALRKADRKMRERLYRGYDKPEYLYIKIHDDPNLPTLIRPLASAIAFAAVAYGKAGESVDPVLNALRFVQSLPHECDQDRIPQWPSESLVRASADCDEKTILVCAILNELMRYYEDPSPPWALIWFPGHLTLGLNSNFCGAWDATKSSAGFDYRGENFRYVEMNWGPDTDVGIIPPEFASQKATVWPHPRLIGEASPDCERIDRNGGKSYWVQRCKT